MVRVENPYAQVHAVFPTPVYVANLGNDLMDKIKVDMENVGKIELQPKFDGKQMIMVVQPV